MHYRMRDNLSFCLIDGQAIFLDIDSDRYFRLPDHLAQSFVQLATRRGECATGHLAAFVALDLIVPTPLADGTFAQACPDRPERSALELRMPGKGSTMSLVPEIVLGAVARRRELRTRQLREVLRDTACYRERQLAARCSTADAGSGRVIELAQRFRQARMHVPIDPCCLPDSLLLVRFLARRGIDSRIVFGVTREPFAAHCWVQAGELVLNDTVGNALAHTPIKVL